MADLIDRQAAIDAVLKRDANCGIDAAETLKALPSAQRWIPVTPETEPKENGEYLVTRESKGLYRYLDIVKKGNVTGKIASDIVAYMPLPKPYKGDDDAR